MFITTFPTNTAFSVLAWVILVASPAVAASGNGQADLLKSKYAQLNDSLRNNQFQRPLVLDSVEAENNVKGDVYAVVNHPFASVSASLQKASNWCDILILHQNTKYCKAVTESGNTELKMMIGKKVTQSLNSAHEVNLGYHLTQVDSNYLSIQLTAASGPMGTKDYRVLLEAIPVSNNQTFMHFTYSYTSGVAGGLALKAYLATAGSKKVGFTPKDGTKTTGDYIGGVRGMMERNTMRYYLAIDTYLGALSVPDDQRLEKRLHDWYNATERYSRQLHEISRNAYLSMKHEEIRRIGSM